MEKNSRTFKQVEELLQEVLDKEGELINKIQDLESERWAYGQDVENLEEELEKLKEEKDEC